MAGDLLDFGIMKSMQALKKSRNDLASADADLAEALTAEKIAIKFDKAMTAKNAQLAMAGDKLRMRRALAYADVAAMNFLAQEIKKLGGDPKAAFNKAWKLRETAYCRILDTSLAKGEIKADPRSPTATDDYAAERPRIYRDPYKELEASRETPVHPANMPMP